MSAPPDRRPLDRAILSALEGNPVFDCTLDAQEIVQSLNLPWLKSVKQVWARAERLADLGLIECGVSIRFGWLTPAGDNRLAELTESA